MSYVKQLNAIRKELTEFLADKSASLISFNLDDREIEGNEFDWYGLPTHFEYDRDGFAKENKVLGIEVGDIILYDEDFGTQSKISIDWVDISTLAEIADTLK